MSVCYRATVRGLVQGVGFRAWTQRHAETLGVRGGVRNLDDGSVEVICEGESAATDAMLALLREGPPGAEVESLQVTPEQPSGQYQSFGIFR